MEYLILLLAMLYGFDESQNIPSTNPASQPAQVQLKRPQQVQRPISVNTEVEKACSQIIALVRSGYSEDATAATRDRELNDRIEQINEFLLPVTTIEGVLRFKVVEVSAPNGLGAPWLAVLNFDSISAKSPQIARQINVIKDKAAKEIRVLRESSQLEYAQRDNRKLDGGRPNDRNQYELNHRIEAINETAEADAKKLVDNNSFWNTVALRASESDLKSLDRGESAERRVRMKLNRVRYYIPRYRDRTIGVDVPDNVPLAEVLKLNQKDADNIHIEFLYDAELVSENKP